MQKKHSVCKACWEKADALKREEIKETDEEFCKEFECFEWAGPKSSFCKVHKAKAEIEAASPSRADSSRPSLSRAAPSSPRPAKSSRRPYPGLSDEDIVEMVAEGVKELARRLRSK